MDPLPPGVELECNQLHMDARIHQIQQNHVNAKYDSETDYHTETQVDEY